MSVKSSMDKTMTALEKGKTKIVRLYDFVNGLTVKNKASFDGVGMPVIVIAVWMVVSIIAFNVAFKKVGVDN